MERPRWWPESLPFPLMAWLFSLLLALVLLLPVAAEARPAWATGSEVLSEPLQVDDYFCEGQPLRAATYSGAVDAVGIPNSAAGTVPGSYVVLTWRDLRLQLPRTNNAGAPSYTDGRWWWRAEDPDRPEFRQRRATVTTYACMLAVAPSSQAIVPEPPWVFSAL